MQAKRGFSPAPLTEHNRRATRESSRLIVDDEIEPRWETMDGFLGALEDGGVPLNVAELVGHGAVRAAVMGALDPTPPDREQLDAMERLAREALDAGCVGISTGLGYPSGIFAKHDELARVAGWAAAAGKLFTSHVRAYSCVSPVFQSDPEVLPHNIEALIEVMRAAKEGGVRLQLSHLIFVGRRTWPNCAQAIAAIERERADGLDVAFDAFPYTAGNTTASVLFPPEMLPHLEAILESPEQLAGVKALGARVFEQIGLPRGRADHARQRAPLRWARRRRSSCPTPSGARPRTASTTRRCRGRSRFARGSGRPRSPGGLSETAFSRGRRRSSSGSCRDPTTRRASPRRSPSSCRAPDTLDAPKKRR